MAYVAMQRGQRSQGAKRAHGPGRVLCTAACCSRPSVWRRDRCRSDYTLVDAGLSAILSRPATSRRCLKATTVKTDRNHARKMVQLLRIGCFRPVHVKAPVVQGIRALLTTRKLLVTKLRDSRAASAASARLRP
jgi:hypothetical protein